MKFLPHHPLHDLFQAPQLRAGPNDEERGQPRVPIRASLARSSSSVSFTLDEQAPPNSRRAFCGIPSSRVKNLETAPELRFGGWLLSFLPARSDGRAILFEGVGQGTANETTSSGASDSARRSRVSLAECARKEDWLRSTLKTSVRISSKHLTKRVEPTSPAHSGCGVFFFISFISGCLAGAVAHPQRWAAHCDLIV